MADPLTDRRQKLRVFFSADIVNSTAYKHRFPPTKHRLEDEWPDVFRGAFNDFDRKFRENLRSAIDADDPVLRSEKGTAPTMPDFWKMNGDELLYTSIIPSERRLLYLQVLAFYTTLIDLDEKLKDRGMGLKGTIWSAGFSIRNRMFELDIHPAVIPLRMDPPWRQISRDLTDIEESFEYVAHKSKYQDYLGVEIDAGFRLSAFTRPGRVAVSIDIARFLSYFTPDRCFHFHHVGWKALRGCYGEKPYPIIWILLGKPARRFPWDGFDCDLTRALLQPNADSSNSAIRQVIDEWVASMEADDKASKRQTETIIRPYVDVSRDPMPKGHTDAWASLDQALHFTDERNDGPDADDR